MRSFKIILFFSPLMLWAQSQYLPLDHWAYRFLERMQAKGMVSGMHFGVRPFARDQIAQWIVSMDSLLQKNPASLSEVEKRYLDRLKGEFWDELALSPVLVPSSEKEPHFYSWKKEHDIFHADVILGGHTIFKTPESPKSERKIYAPYYGGIFRGNLWNIGFFSDTRIFSEWGTRKYIQNYRASKGYPKNAEKDSSRATWDVSNSYFTFRYKGFHFQYGRDAIQWGTFVRSGLMFSGLAPGMDLFKLEFRLRSTQFIWFHGELRSDYSHKWVSAHKLAFTPTRGIDLGFQEAVIYAKRGIELAYANPVLPFKVAEHTLGDRDNVVFGGDVNVYRFPPFRWYGEIFVDDLWAPWDIFSDYWGNKYAIAMGGLWVDPLRISNSSLRIEYTRVEPFVYTHTDSANVFEHYNFCLGSSLEPNSDQWTIQWEKWQNLFWRGILGWEMLRHGEGDRRRPHLPEDGEKKHFLGGIVETTHRLWAQIEYEPRRDWVFRMELAGVWKQNWDRIKGKNGRWIEWILGMSWNW